MQMSDHNFLSAEIQWNHIGWTENILRKRCSDKVHIPCIIVFSLTLLFFITKYNMPLSEYSNKK